MGRRIKAYGLSSDVPRIVRCCHTCTTTCCHPVKSKVDTMVNFFVKGLDCDLEMSDAGVILLEFEKETTAEMWFFRGTQLFGEERYELASSCFNAAADFGWSAWARGRHLLAIGQKNEAKVIFMTAAKNFFESRKFEHCLDVLSELSRIGLPWDDADNEILDAALEKLPHYLPRRETVKFALFRGAWNTISVDDLQDDSFSALFHTYRGNSNLKRIIRVCSEEERSLVEIALPNVVGDYYLDQKKYSDATRLFLRGSDQESAMQATEAAMKDAPAGHGDLSSIADHWRQVGKAKNKLTDEDAISLLVLLFESPKNAAAKYAEACMKKLGPSIVRLAVDSTGSSAEDLHSFHRTAFEAEVLDALTTRYSESLVDVIHWYCERRDKEHALTFAEKNLTSWSDGELLDVIMGKWMLRPRGLLDALASRKILVEAVQLCLSAGSFDLDFAKAASNKALESIKSASQKVDTLLKVWNARRDDRQVKEFLSREASSSLTVLLWRLFDNPKAVNKKYRKKCMQVFGKDVVRKAVLACAPYKNDSVYSVLCLFDKEAFASDKPAEPKRKVQATTATRRGEQAASRGDQATSRDQASLGGQAKTGDHANHAAESKFEAGGRVIVTGLKQNTHLNGQHGKVIKFTENKRYIVVLDSDKKGTKPRAVLPQNLISEENENSDSSSLPSLMARGQGGRNNDASSIDSDSSGAVPPPAWSFERKAPRGDRRQVLSVPRSSSQHQQHGGSNDQDGYKTSSSDDESLDQGPGASRGDSGFESDMPELESKASSDDSTDSDGALPSRRKQAEVSKNRTASASQSHSWARQELGSDDSSQDSIPPLQEHVTMFIEEDSTDSSISGIPGLLAGSGSSGGSSVASELELPHASRKYSSDDSSEDGGVPKLSRRSRFQQRDKSDSEDSLPMPGLEAPRGAQDSGSDDESSSSGSSKLPELKSPPPDQDSSDDSMPALGGSSDDEPPALIERGGSMQAQAPRQSQQPPRNAAKKKSKKGRRSRGGGGGKSR